MVVIHSCDSLTGISWYPVIPSIDTVDKVEGVGSVSVQCDPAFNDAQIGFEIPPDWSLYGSLKFYIKVSNPSKLIYINVYAPDSSNIFQYDLYLDVADMWRQVTIPLSSFTVREGNPNWSTITRFLMRYYNKYVTEYFKVDLVELDYLVTRKVTVYSEPIAVIIKVDGQPRETPFTVEVPDGSQVTLTAAKEV